MADMARWYVAMSPVNRLDKTALYAFPTEEAARRFADRARLRHPRRTIVVQPPT